MLQLQHVNCAMTGTPMVHFFDFLFRFLRIFLIFQGFYWLKFILLYFLLPGILVLRLFLLVSWMAIAFLISVKILMVHSLKCSLCEVGTCTSYLMLCNKLSQTQWLKMTNVFHLMVSVGQGMTYYLFRYTHDLRMVFALYVVKKKAI